MAGSTTKDEGVLSTLDEIQSVYRNLVAQEVFILRKTLSELIHE
jgi:hypothetical protein